MSDDASPGRRFGAFLVDQMLIIMIMLPGFFWYARGLFSDQSGIYLLGYGPWWFVTWFLVSLLYHIIGWITRGGTVGCRAFGIAVRTTTGKQISWIRALVRLLICYISFGIGWIPYWFTEPHQNVHDLAARTIVIRTEHRQKTGAMRQEPVE